jgi:hypothetical protein
MARRRPFAILTGVVLVAAASAALAVAGVPGMMTAQGGRMGGPYGGLGAGGAGATGVAVPTPAQLRSVGSHIDTWLAQRGFSGFTVAEVMAFTNNDYVAVHDPNGMPAFELLTDLKTTWVMEEPPSMMWNTRYGIMGRLGSRISPMMGGWMMGGSWQGWYGNGSGRVTSTAQAVRVANDWLAEASPGEQISSDAGGSAMGHFPGYYSFDTTKGGKTVGMLSVNASTGTVWYHAWHGTFLGELDF